jgi:serine/threonine protein kinase
MIGSEIGHYRIVRLLGKGGMGEVYLADDTRLQRQVALKVLNPEVAADPDRRDRFAREARAAAALNHPNIVTIHSVEEANGRLFLTLEHIEGRTLGDVIPPGGLPIDRLLSIGISLADAVGAAH